jgi:hypothetical protein
MSDTGSQTSEAATLSSRSAKILEILANRRPFAKRANQTVEQLRLVSAALAEFVQFLPNMLQRDIPEESRNKISQLERQIPALQASITKQQADLLQLALRFGRNTLNIGIVGNARQGKSTFLQALTGLTNEEIPAAETDHCTGAPSLIINHKDTYADVEYFSESGFLQEIISPFYMQLSLTPLPTSFHAFMSAPLAAPNRKLSATEDALYDKLKYRHMAAKEYQQFLGKPPERIGKDKIRSCIAQQDVNGKKIATWLAVRMATIYCPFRVADAGGISVCDTPGLGDFVCGAEDSLVQNIGRNLDAVLMLKRTPKGGIATPEDTQLYDLLPKAVNEFEPSSWSYFIVNRDGTENETKSFESQIQQKIQCRRFITLDARNSGDVLNRFDSILEDIASNQQALDRTLSDARFETLKAIIAQTGSLLDEAKTALPKSVRSDVMGAAELHSLFDPLWNTVAHHLQHLTHSYRESRDKTGRLNEQVDGIQGAVLAQVRKRLEQVQPSDYAGQGLPQFTSDMFHELRVTLATAFDKLDDDLTESIDILRSEVCEIFWSHGRLKGLFEASNPQLWLRQLAEAWKSLDDGRPMAGVIARFANTEFTFRGYLLAKVRGTLDPLDEESTASVHYRFAIGNKWDDVRGKLWSACNNAVADCADVLKGLSVDKNGALFSCNEQFTDGVLRLGGWNRARQLWANFYDEYKSEIWAERFSKIEVNKALRRDWDSCVLKLESALQSLISE